MDAEHLSVVGLAESVGMPVEAFCRLAMQNIVPLVFKLCGEPVAWGMADSRKPADGKPANLGSGLDYAALAQVRIDFGTLAKTEAGRRAERETRSAAEGDDDDSEVQKFGVPSTAWVEIEPLRSDTVPGEQLLCVLQLGSGLVTRVRDPATGRSGEILDLPDEVLGPIGFVLARDRLCITARAWQRLKAQDEGLAAVGDAPPPGLRLPDGVTWGALADLLNSAHPRHAPELATAVRAWIECWHPPEIATNADVRAVAAARGHGADAQKRIATVANPAARKDGGAPPKQN